MAYKARSTSPLREIGALFETGVLGDLPDDQLLGLFTARGNAAEAAFVVLVRRHGPMVLGACRAVLRDHHAAEDAFQATFLLLARRAERLWVGDSLGPWLHAVACRVSRSARERSSRRHARETALAMTGRTLAVYDHHDDSGALLHEEIDRLPGPFRVAVTLCDLEGLTQDEAARRLGWPAGTVRSRLARGRQRLRARLVRRGIAPALAGCGGLAEARAIGSLAEKLARTTVQAAVQSRVIGGPVPASLAARQLAKGATAMAYGSTVRTAVMCLLAVGLAAAGAGALVGQERKEPSEPPAADPTRAGTARVEALERRVHDLERKLQKVVDAVEASRANGERRSPLRTEDNAAPTRKVRVRLRCLVEKLLVKEGQAIKAGDPLAELYSTDLIAAKNELLTKALQWDRDERLLQAREKLHKQGSVSTQVYVDSQNAVAKSHLDMVLARDRLVVYGLTPEEIAAVKDQAPERKGQLILRSPVAGVVSRIEAQPDDLLDEQAVVLTIRPASP